MSGIRIAGVFASELFHAKGGDSWGTIAVVLDADGRAWPWALAPPGAEDMPRGCCCPLCAPAVQAAELPPMRHPASKELPDERR